MTCLRQPRQGPMLAGTQAAHHLAVHEQGIYLLPPHIDIRDVVCRRVFCTLDRMCQPELFHPSPWHSLPRQQVWPAAAVRSHPHAMRWKPLTQPQPVLRLASSAVSGGECVAACARLCGARAAACTRHPVVARSSPSRGQLRVPLVLPRQPAPRLAHPGSNPTQDARR